jgi:phosphoribosylformylglycinamidine synthase
MFVIPSRRSSTEDNALLLIDLGKGHNALGATALAQVYRQLGDKPADVRDVAQLKGFWDAMQALVAQRKLLAYHDRSDGGLLVTLAEMAFTGHCGVEADIAALGDDRLAALFNEELGAVIQVRAADREAVEAILAVNGLADCVHYLGKAVEGDRFVLTAGGQTVFRKPHHAAHVVGGNHLADAASARQPGLRRSGARGESQ